MTTPNPAASLDDSAPIRHLKMRIAELEERNRLLNEQLVQHQVALTTALRAIIAPVGKP